MEKHRTAKKRKSGTLQNNSKNCSTNASRTRCPQSTHINAVDPRTTAVPKPIRQKPWVQLTARKRGGREIERSLGLHHTSRNSEILFHHNKLVSGFRPGIDATQQGPDFLEPCLFEVLRRQGSGCFVGTGAINHDFRIAVVML